MKLFSTVILLTLSSAVFANEGEMLAKAKEHQQANIDKRISWLQEMKSCVSGAADKAAMKKCHQDHKAKMETLKDENESWRDNMREERKSRRKK